MEQSKVNQDRTSFSYLLQWLLISIFAGFIGSVFMHFFVLGTKTVSSLIRESSIPLIFWPFIGAVVVGGLVYRFEPRAKGEGIPSYLIALRQFRGRLSRKESFFKLLAAFITLGTFGNGGFLGPGGRVSAGIMSALHRLVPKRFSKRDQDSLFTICGLAAAFGALFHSPIGGGVFAVEIIQKANMPYKRLFPAILASTSSVFFSRIMGFQGISPFPAIQSHINIKITGLILAVSLVGGLAGRLYIELYGGISHTFDRESSDHSRLGMIVRLLIGSGLAFVLVYFINPQLIGTSEGIFGALLVPDPEILRGGFSQEIPLFLILILLMVLKALANCLIIGSGMSAGFAGPAMLIGMLLGAAMADLFNIPTNSPEYYALLAAGFASVFSSTMNTPIATGILAVEIFGLYYSLPASLAAVIGFQINRHNTLYDTVLEDQIEASSP